MTPLLMHGVRLGAAWLMRGGHKSVANAVSGAACSVRHLWGGVAPIEQWCDEAGWPARWTSEDSLWVLVDSGEPGVLVVQETGSRAVCFATQPAACFSLEAGKTLDLRLTAEMARRNRRMRNAVWQECRKQDTGTLHCLLQMQVPVSGLSASDFCGICRELAEEAESLNAFINRTLR